MGRKNYTSCSQDGYGKNYMFEKMICAESCVVVEFCLEKEKEKPLGPGEGPGGQWEEKITYFGPKMNSLKIRSIVNT